MYMASVYMAGRLAPVGDMETEVRGNVGFLIWRVGMRWRAATDRALAPLGLTHAQYSVLAPLYGMSQAGARPSQRELADFTGLDAIYVSKLVRALEREGFVTRSASTSDPRAVELSLTEKGVATVRDGVRIVAGVRDQLTEPLGGNAGTGTAELARLLLELLEAPETEG
jgi:DNA-binding MarR family transcriptional regulator